MGAQFLTALAPIHYGQFGGLPIKIAWALLGLTPTLLFVSGLIAWNLPRKRQPAKVASPGQLVPQRSVPARDKEAPLVRT
jgi:uncharacterized iron-regulated membrane protein